MGHSEAFVAFKYLRCANLASVEHRAVRVAPNLLRYDEVGYLPCRAREGKPLLPAGKHRYPEGAMIVTSNKWVAE